MLVLRLWFRLNCKKVHLFPCGERFFFYTGVYCSVEFRGPVVGGGNGNDPFISQVGVIRRNSLMMGLSSRLKGETPRGFFR